jgi:hypothetical protein
MVHGPRYAVHTRRGATKWCVVTYARFTLDRSVLMNVTLVLVDAAKELMEPLPPVVNPDPTDPDPDPPPPSAPPLAVSATGSALSSAPPSLPEGVVSGAQ